ncbi:DnaT-like ssDNA-binding protein [Fusobacterium necrophorum]|uniref:DnaT-like ssDNA-binding protein n=1 Tax=Fusobacterium necrophorum TaxID=859 RepID=UPI00309BFD74
MIGYVTVEEAQAFLTARHGEIDKEELEKALYQAFDKIEAIGARNGRMQGEKNFPRLHDSEEVMKLIQRVQMLEAYAMMNGGNEDIKRLGKGISGKSIGDMSVSYDRSQKIGEITFASVEAARIMKRFSQKTF